MSPHPPKDLCAALRAMKPKVSQDEAVTLELAAFEIEELREYKWMYEDLG